MVEVLIPIIYAIILIAIFSLLSAAIGYFFERRMGFSQHLWVSFVAWGTMLLLLVAFFLVTRHLGLSGTWSTLATLTAMLMAGSIITRLAAKNYGAEKKGMLGVGAKVVLSLYGISALMGLTFALLSA